MTTLRVICNGGFAKEVIVYAGQAFMGVTIAEPTDLRHGDQLVVNRGDEFVIACGDPVARRRLFQQITAAGGKLATLVHPSAWVAPTAQLGPGTIICPFGFVGPDATVGANTVINVYGCCGHDAVIGSHSVLSPYAFAAGNSTIGEATFLAAHAMVAPGIAVGAWSKLSAATFLNRDVPDGSLVTGNPAVSRVMFKAGS